MRRIAIINQKGGVGKTTTAVNLGAALARFGRRVVLVDVDPQANLSMHLGVEVLPGEPSTYTLLSGAHALAEAIRDTGAENLRIVPSHLDLSGSELELSGVIGRERVLQEAVEAWEQAALEQGGPPPADYLIFDCPPSLGLLAINALVACRELIVTLQTEFFAMQGMTKLVEDLIQRRMNPELEISGILPCLYDSRLKLAREVLGEIRKYFPGKVFPRPVRTNVKLAECPSFGQTIFQYAPECNGARDHERLARDVIAAEPARDHELASRLPQPEPPPHSAAPWEPSPERASSEGVLAPQPPPETAAGPGGRAKQAPPGGKMPT